MVQQSTHNYRHALAAVLSGGRRRRLLGGSEPIPHVYQNYGLDGARVGKGAASPSGAQAYAVDAQVPHIVAGGKVIKFSRAANFWDHGRLNDQANSHRSQATQPINDKF